MKRHDHSGLGILNVNIKTIELDESTLFSAFMKYRKDESTKMNALLQCLKYIKVT